MDAKEDSTKCLKKLWNYDHDDKTTWKYSDVIIGGGGGRKFIKEWILNPDFQYKHLDHTYPLALL